MMYHVSRAIPWLTAVHTLMKSRDMMYHVSQASTGLTSVHTLMKSRDMMYHVCPSHPRTHRSAYS